MHRGIFPLVIHLRHKLIKDITYINVFNKLKDISNLIDNDNIDLAYSSIKELIEQFKELYERNS